jgi:hypothetical protein
MTVRGKDVWGGDISLDFDVEVYDLIPHFDSNSWMGMCASSWTVKYRELKTGAKFEEIVNLEDLKSEQKDDRGRI